MLDFSPRIGHYLGCACDSASPIGSNRRQNGDGGSGEKGEVNPPAIKPIDMVNLAFQFATLAYAIGVPLWRIVTTGRLWPSFLRMWLYLILWTLLFCMVIPWFITYTFHQRHVFERFPDGIGMGAALCFGWFPCMIFCSIAWTIRTFWMQFRSRRNSS
jgi:hypothetical protein